VLVIAGFLPNLFADVPCAGFFEILGSYPDLFSSLQDADRAVLAKPIECNLRIAPSRHNTITVLFDEHNIMLFLSNP
jgi:hypothetical protein